MADALPLIPPSGTNLTLSACRARFSELLAVHVSAINQFWAGLKSPDSHKSGAAWVDLRHDLMRLAREDMATPDVDTCMTTFNSLWLEAINDAPEWFQEKSPAPVMNGQLVAVLRKDTGYLVAHRYQGPRVYGLHEDDAVETEGDYWRFSTPMFEHHDEQYSNYGVPSLYVFGQVDTEGRNWSAADFDRVVRPHCSDIDAMEVLIDRGVLSPDLDGFVLPRFPSEVVRELVGLKGLQSWLYEEGMADEQEVDVRRAARADYESRIAHLRQQRSDIDQQIGTLVAQAQEAELVAMEQYIGFCRGQRVRHLSSGEEGKLVASTCSGPGLAVTSEETQSSRRPRNVVEELRRGEWVVVETAAAGEA
ncbi:hypothetical protein SAMN05216576_107206 [Ectopseudomonas chengduensis]|jgi:hypothetical protein|uniref:Uncharacterized protein n=1 Tax=Ectopseudomonas chengduensis TaxID=489632 RepID=A0A1G6Q1N8_9GAMM|nr:MULTISPECIES: hypothetical protein [Pseudomonas]MBP3062033.1 hypothetical protein [Pseudomonas chengduensis]NNB75326.1 hypothetical protein [Pseudomonas chengduensis]OEO24428.1 hypothetical protein AX279_17315 [Pseudomonas sp. J237]SDC86228.1 hypothetical protein SAMN05216576_107206 [Pseudomonas chengduensis]